MSRLREASGQTQNNPIDKSKVLHSTVDEQQLLETQRALSNLRREYSELKVREALLSCTMYIVTRMYIKGLQQGGAQIR